MAIVDKNANNFTGKLGDLTFYRVSGSDRVRVRHARGPSSERVKTERKFQRTRENAAELGGSSTAGRHIREMLRLQTTGSQLLVHSDINACLRGLVPLDTNSLRGERSVLISKGGRALEGLPLNTGNSFDAQVRATITCETFREACAARIEIPELTYGGNLRLTRNLPMYRIVCMLIYIPDFFYVGPGQKYEPAPGHFTNGYTMVDTPWYPMMDGSPATTLDLQLKMPAPPPDEHYSLLVAVTFHQGEVYRGMEAKKDEKAGAGKILKVF